MDVNSISKKVQDLVGEGKLENAIEFLKENAEDQSEIAQLSCQYYELKRKDKLNIISEAEVSIERNKITSAVLAISEGDSVKTTEPNSKNDRPKSNAAQKVLALCVVLTLAFSLYVFFGDKNGSVPEAKPKEHQQIDSQTNVVEEDKPNGKNEASVSNGQPKKTKNTSTNSKMLNEIIKYKGIPIEKAYFIVEDCNDCNSSISNKKGEVKANIPLDTYKSRNKFNFLVYSNDTFLYAKKMRFTSLDFNKY